MLYSIVGMLVIILDQLVKFWVDRNINWTNPTREIIPGILSLVRVQNDGAAFSFLSGSGARIWFIVIAGVFAVLVVLALATNFVSGKFGRWCLVFITAGGLSNMIDRIRYGYVIDMFKVELFDFAVFNVADIFITVFCIAFIIYILFGGEKRKDENTDEFDDYDDEDYDRPVRTSAKKRSSRRYEEEEDYGTRRPSRRRVEDYYDEEEDDEETPRKRVERSAAAAAKAYSRSASAISSRRRETDEDEQTTSRTSRRAASQTEPPTVRPTRRPSAQTEEQTVWSGRRSTSQPEEQTVRSARRTASQTEQMTAKSGRRATSQQEEPAAGRTVRSAGQSTGTPAPIVSPTRRSAPVSDSSNPFAEWEQANERVSSGRNFTDLSAETSGKGAAPRTTAAKPETVRTSPAPARPVNTSSDDFDLDAILSEFQ